MKRSIFLALFLALLLCIGIFAADTVYIGSTEHTENVYDTLEEAVTALPDSGGTVVVSGDITVGTASAAVALPAKSGKVVITGEKNAKLTIAYGLRLGSETEIDNVVLVNSSTGMGFICAMGNKLTVGEGVTTERAGTNRWLSLYGGNNVEKETTAYNAHMIIRAGTWRHIYGGSKGIFNGDATVEVSNVNVTNNLSARNEAGTFSGTATLIANLCGGKTVTAGTYVQTPSFLVDDGYKLVLTDKTYSQEKLAEGEGTVYVGGTGAYTTLASAIEALPLMGGKVIVTGDTAVGTASAAETLPAKLGKVTITAENGAKLLINWGLYLGSETEFDNIELVNVSGSMGFICAKGNKLTIGEKVTTSITNSVDRWLSLYGGNNVTSETTSYDAHLIIKAGKWRHIFGGSKGTFNGDAVVEVSNITVTNNLSAKNEAGTFNGDATLIANLCGSKTVTAGKYIQTPTVLVDDGYKAVLNNKTYSQEKLAEDEGTVYVDGTGKTDGAYTTLESAIEALPLTGGKVIVSGDTTVGEASAAVTLPTKSGKVTITGENGAKLKIAYGVVLGSETEIDNVELVNVSAVQGYIAADGNKLTIGENIITNRENTERWLTILGGNKTSVVTSYNTDLSVKAGTYRYIYGGNSTATFNGNATVEVSNITVTTLSAANEKGLFNGTARLIVNLCGSKTVTATTYGQMPTVLVDDGYTAMHGGNIYFQMPEVYTALDTVYVQDGGTGDGSSAQSPIGIFATAYALLGEDGGEIVLTGDTTVGGALSVAECTGDVTIRAQNGAKLILNGSLVLAKNTGNATITFDLPIEAVNSTIYGGFHSVTFTENCIVTGTLDFYGGLPSVVDGGDEESRKLITDLPYTITVKNGTFRTFAGGVRRLSPSHRLGAVAGHLTVNISGGTFTNRFTLSGESILADDVTLNISGGDFACPIYVRGMEYVIDPWATTTSNLVAADRNYYAMDGDIVITISGGNFTGGLIGAHEHNTVYTQVLRGNYTLDITGGTFAEGTVLDATQVKAYAGVTDKLASVTYSDGYTFDVVCFDNVNGVATNCKEPIRVAFIGDSITEGALASNRMHMSYPAQFATLAKEKGQHVVVSNLGIGASGLLGGENDYYRAARKLTASVLLHETDADYYVIGLGCNDFRVALYNGYFQKYIDEYTAFVEDLSALPDVKKIYVTSSILFGLDDEGTRSMAISAVVGQLQARLAKTFAKEDAEKYVFVDMYALTMPKAEASELLSSDGCHPHDSGYGNMANAMYNAIFHSITAPTEDYHRTEIYVSESGTPFASGSAEDPVSRLDRAMAMIPEGAEATIHLNGIVTYNKDIMTAINPAKLTFVGEGEGATFEIGGELFALNSNVMFDNLILRTTASTAMIANYHDVEMTDTVTLTGDWSFYAGHRVYQAPYGTEATVSSDNDCTITLNGNGSFKNFVLGNLRMHAAAPIGTYSGDLTATIGENYTATGSLVGAVGQNYLTGSVTVSSPINLTKYVEIGTLESTVAYDAAKNTGIVTMTYTGEAIADTVYLDGTGATEGAYATLETAIAALPDAGGTVILCGDTVLGDANNGVFTPAKSGTVSVIGQADTNGVLPKLTIARTLHLEGDLSLDNLNLCNASAQFGYIYARGHKLTLGENISTSIGGSATTYPWVFGGHHNADVASTHLVILAGTYNGIYGANFGATFTGTSKVEVSNVTVVGTLSAKSIENFKGTAELILDLRNDKTVTAATFVEPTFLVDNSYEAVKDGNTYKQQKAVIAGDINGDKAVTVVDVLMVIKAILNESELENADMNGDGNLTLLDVVRVLKAITA